MKRVLADIYDEYLLIEAKIKVLEQQLVAMTKSNPTIARLMTIPGIGYICATALVASVGTPNNFKNGRHFASWMGLTPKEYSSGGKQKLLGITKRGNNYLRKLLVHGARSVVYYAQNRNDSVSTWINSVKQRVGTNKTVVAVANKNARIVWSLLVCDDVYQPKLAH